MRKPPRAFLVWSAIMYDPHIYPSLGVTWDRETLYWDQKHIWQEPIGFRHSKPYHAATRIHLSQRKTTTVARAWAAATYAYMLPS